MIKMFEGCSRFEHFVLNYREKNITRTQDENKLDDPISLLQFFNVLYVSLNCAKLEKNLDSTSFSRELPELSYCVIG